MLPSFFSLDWILSMLSLTLLITLIRSLPELSLHLVSPNSRQHVLLPYFGFWKCPKLKESGCSIPKFSFLPVSPSPPLCRIPLSWWEFVAEACFPVGVCALSIRQRQNNYPDFIWIRFRNEEKWIENGTNRRYLLLEVNENGFSK